MNAPLDIAIVGLAGVYPGSADAGAFWQNICAKFDAITDADPEWTGPYFEANTKADDRIYTTKGGFLRELAEVDPIEIGIMPSVAAGSDPDHLITLKVARDALADAGYLNRRFDGSRAGIVIARGTYGNRGMASMLARGFFMDQMMDVIRHLRPDFSESEIRELQSDLKKQLPPYGGDVVGVLTPNVIASLVANRLDLMGPAYIVDAACASSLIAIDAAAQELVNGRCDLMLAGGTQVQTPPQLFIQFCQISALSRDRLRPFQKGSEGTLLGEGCGMLVLKRLADAEAHGDRIYAVIKGIGTASDGKAKGLLAPRLEGEVLSMRRAYESSGIDPRTIDLIEAHGTGTSLGDKTEIEALTAIFGARGAGPRIAISAVKSMIGHCLPATGTASMIKTALALHHKILPPMLCDVPDPALNLEATPFYINNQTRPWVHGASTPRRAGVSAFGFGGINGHVILEEYASRGAGANKGRVAGLKAPRGSEIFLLAADTHAQLVALSRAALGHLKSPQPPSLAELCRSAAVSYSKGEHRLAILAESTEELVKRLEQALEKLRASGAKPFKTRGGVWYGVGPVLGRTCILFPGEGSQYTGMLADVCMHFPQVRDWFDFIEENALARGSRSRAEILFPAPTLLDDAARTQLEQALYEMDIGAESVFAASLGLQALFDDIGLVPDAMLGHSTGENTALTACRVRRFTHREEVSEAVQAVNRLFRKLEAEGRIVHGSLLTIGGLHSELRAQLLAEVGMPGGRMQLAMDNCPNQVVLFGPPEDASRLREMLSAEGAICQELPFGRAYHTPLFKPLADAFRDYFKTLDFGPGRVPLYSARSCGPFPAEPDAIRELTAQQWENPVRFTETLARMYADGFRVFLEVGPSGNLTSFVSDTLRAHDDVIAVSANSRRKPGLAHLHQTLGQLFAAGVPFQPARLYAHRQIAEFDLLADPRPAKKGKPRQALTMPVVTLPEKWKQKLPGGGGAPVSQTAVSALSPTSVGSVPAATSPAATVVLSTPASQEDPRLTTLQAHFSLMQEFLESQARVLGLATGTAPAPAIVVKAMPPPSPDTHQYPLLGKVVEATPDRLVIERRYDLDTDLFIRDHCVGGQPSLRDPSLRAIPVIPFTYSMEILAQAAAKLLNRADRCVIAIENSRGSRWLSLDDGQIELRIVAQRAGEDRVSCRMFLLGQGGPPIGIPVFEASVVFAERYPEPPAPMAWPDAQSHPPRFNADGQLYVRGMFHGPRMQGAQRVRRWSESAIELDVQILPTHDYFAFTQRPQFQADATLSDVLGQNLYYWLQEQFGGEINCFPFQIARLSMHAPPPPAGTQVISRAHILSKTQDRLAGSIDAFDAAGRLLMRMEMLEDRTFTVPARFYQYRLDPARRFISERWMEGLLPTGLCARRIEPFADELLSSGGGLWGRGLAHMTLNRAERARYYALPSSGPRREEWLMGRIAAKEAARDWFLNRHQITLASADVEIDQDANGRPLIRCTALGAAPMPAVSISHSQRWGAAVVAEPGLSVGLDYQRLDRLRGEELIRGGFGGEELSFIEATAPAERGLVACALWCAKEAASKAAGTGLEGRPLDWQIVASSLDPRTVSFGSARVRHAGRDHDVALQFEAREAISALCLSVASDGLSVAVAR
ncbi:MAG: beta-ketoacyl synthase N-terminal-like domain-containing protein [Panacagrimonas sp.]